MPIARDANSSGTVNAATSLTYSHTNGTISNTVLWVGIHIGVAANPSPSVTYGGVAMTKAIEKFATDLGWQYLFYLANPATGANNVSISWTGNANTRSTSSSYTGCRQTGIPDSSNSGNIVNGASPLTVSTTVVASNSWLACRGGSNLTGSLGVGTGTSLVVQSEVGFQLFGDSNGTVGTGAQSQQTTWTGNDNTGLVVVSFAPAVAVSPASNLPLMGVG